MFCNDLIARTQSSLPTDERYRGVSASGLIFPGTGARRASVWACFPAARLVTTIFAGICCAVWAAPAGAGFVATDCLSLNQHAASRMIEMPALGDALSQFGYFGVECRTNQLPGCEMREEPATPVESSASPFEGQIPSEMPLPIISGACLSGGSMAGSGSSAGRRGGASSAGLLGPRCQLAKPVRSHRPREQEVQFIPDAPHFELLHPS